MTASRSRYSLFLIVVTLLMGLIPASARAQSDEDLTSYTDAMDGETPALLNDESPDPARFFYAYANGEYILQALEPAHTGDLFSYIDVGPLTDSVTAVDAAVAGNQTGKYVFAGCRAGDDHNGYYVAVHPLSGMVSLWRLDSDSPVQLAEETTSDLIVPGYELNRIEIDCSLDTITGSVNGEIVVSASDDTYQSGISYIGAGNDAQFPDVLFAVFDNLEVLDQQSAAASPVPASPSPIAGSALTGTEVPAEPVADTGSPSPAEAEAAAETAAPTETAAATETAVPTATPTSTATAARTETPVPEVSVDTAALEASVIEFAVAVGPIAGPFSGDLQLTHASVQTLQAGVQVSNFHTEVQFLTPIGAPPGFWSIGFCFWLDFAGNCYDAFIRSDGATAEWVYGRSDATGAFELFQSGPITGLDLTPGASNFIGLSVVDGTGIFIVNSPNPAASFAISTPPEVGDIIRFAGFEATDETNTAFFTLSTQGFYVWDLSGLSAPGAALTGTAEPTATATAEPTATTTTEPEPTAEATAEPTEDPEPTAEATAAEPTEEAEPTAEGVSADDDASAFADLKDQALGQQPLGGPYADTMLQSFLSLNYASAILSLTDVYTTATFLNPADTSVPWDFTVGIRAIGDNTEPIFTLQSNGDWSTSFGDGETILSGQAPQIDTLPLGANTIEFAAQGDTGYVAVNGIVVTQVDLTQANRPGDVFVGTGFFSANNVEGRPVGYQDFQIWEIPASAPSETEPPPSDTASVSTETTSPFEVVRGDQIAGPFAGVLSESIDAIEFYEAAVDTADFYTSVVFTVPDDDSDPWDFTIAFRHTSGNDQYRLTIVSDGTWLFALGSDAPIAAGSLANLNSTPGQENTIDLFVQGGGGAVALNGVEFSTLDVSDRPDSGDIWIATGGNTENTVAGRTTPYRDFAVWSLN